MYLFYDVKGIQQFIFSVPKLKCVIGASGIIADFDARWATPHDGPTARRIFTGGGRGAFKLADREAAETLARRLVEDGNNLGLDIRIGIHDTLSGAATGPDRLYPCLPRQGELYALDGEPCSMSGLWPVAPGKGMGSERDVHPLIWARREKAKEDPLGKWILDQLADHQSIKRLKETAEPEFFKTVDPEEDKEEASAGSQALGGRQRWAVVAMDGNDMGRQFLAAEGKNWSDQQMSDWLSRMSENLAACTREAFLEALGKAIQAWESKLDADRRKVCLYDKRRRFVLPFRPLILGGDDVILLCHSSHAIQFVQDMAGAFQERSVTRAKDSGQPLWPATGDRLSISGGVLFCKVTFPLHMAIPYAEVLLANAKSRFRRLGNGGPMPAAIDWETITDTLVDTPEARRNRELSFYDQDIDGEVRLTRRPYVLEPSSEHPTLESLLELKKQLGGVPTSMRARILPSLQRPWGERVEFVASVKKRHKILWDQLWESESATGAGWVPDESGKGRETGVPDALLLLEEEQRFEDSAT